MSHARSIAIIGYACRFPAASFSPEDFWQKIKNGGPGVLSEGMSRWENASKRGYAKYMAGILEGLDKFDADFFGIPPREAASMDPQQRLFLETSWEAIENSGIQHEALLETNTGVFVGSVALDYRDRFTHMSTDHVDAYGLTGNLMSVISGRISHVLGLEGPCMTIDTACSSSLVAVHQACQNLRSGECDLAIAGGVNVILSPVGMELLDKARTLSPDGTCWAFDERANGIARGEGCGVIVLKRLEDAINANDRILCIVRGTAINHDGRAASLSSPNMLSQKKLLQKALQDGQLDAADVGYIEMHGTGTKLGDPIEIQAIKQVYGEPRNNGGRCYLGSVKSIIGHLEGAAGIAGLFKAMKVLEHKVIPPQFNLRKINPALAIEGSALSISKEIIPWNIDKKKHRIAGVSSFGISGTNAHVLLEAYAPPVLKKYSNKTNEPKNITISAKTPEALGKIVTEFSQKVEEKKSEIPAQSSLGDISYSSSVRRSHYKERISVTASSLAELSSALIAYNNNLGHPGLKKRGQDLRKNKIAFVFPGLGSQWLGMGKDLYRSSEIFKEKIQACDKAIRSVVGWSILDKLGFHKEMNADNHADIETIQLNLFSICVAIASVWKEWGIKPRAYVGHSFGEVGAAYCAGIIELEDAVNIIFKRSKILGRFNNKGAMAIVEADWAKARTIIEGYRGYISLAGANSQRFTLLSGDTEKLKELREKCHKDRLFFRLIKGSTPSHSALLDPYLRDLEEGLIGVTPNDVKVNFYSSWKVERILPNEIDAKYWVNNLRQPVMFEKTISKMIDDGFTNFVEISPHPTLINAINEIANHRNIPIQTTPSLREGVPGNFSMLESLGELYVTGINVDWSCHHDSSKQRFIPLPSYPWQKERYWIDDAPTYFSASDAQDISVQKLNSDHYFCVQWKEVELKAPHLSLRTGGKWLLVGPNSSDVQKVKFGLEEKGFKVVQIVPEDLCAEVALSDVHSVSMENEEEFVEVIEKHFNDASAFLGVIHMYDVQQTQGEDSLELPDNYGFLSLLYVFKALERLSLAPAPVVTVVTKGVAPVEGQNISSVQSVMQASLWGMLESVRYEIPNLNSKAIDLSHTPSDEEIKRLVLEILNEGRESHIAMRPKKKYVARLTQGQTARSNNIKQRDDFKIRENGNYIITGGLGGIGLKLAKFLTEQGAKCLTLLSRTGINESNADQRVALEAMRDMGVQIFTPSVDVSDLSALSKVFDGLKAMHPPIAGIIHAAGILEDGFITNQTKESFQRVFLPKVYGALNLDQLTQDMNLDFFILYSSASAVVGSPGQTNYSAANACLDTLARLRKSKGLKALSVNWGVFNDVGLATENSLRADRLQKRGIGGINFKESEAVLLEALNKDISNIGFMPFNAEKWAEFYPQVRRVAYMDELLHGLNKKKSPWKDLKTLIQETPGNKGLEMTSHYVQDLVASILQQNPNKLILDEPFSNFGMDSLTGLELRNRLELETGEQLPATLIWTYANIRALSKYLVSLLRGNEQMQAKAENKLTEQELVQLLEEELRA